MNTCKHCGARLDNGPICIYCSGNNDNYNDTKYYEHKTINEIRADNNLPEIKSSKKDAEDLASLSPCMSKKQVKIERKVKEHALPENTYSSTSYMKRYFKKASKRHYEEWLKGWIENGGAYYKVDEPFCKNDFYIATRDFELQSLYGSLSFDVIAPKGIRFVAPNGYGHCNIYDMNDLTIKGTHSYYAAPVYTNTRIKLK